MRSFKFFFFFALMMVLFFWVAKFLFMAFLLAGALTLVAFVFRGIARLFGFRPRRFGPRFRAEPLDSSRQPYTMEPIAPRAPRRFEGFGDIRTIEIH
jgi:hypothetical protein